MPYMIAHRAREADATRRTLGLKSHRHIDSVAVQVCSIGYSVANIDPDAETNGPIGRLVAIQDRNLLLDSHSAADRTIDAVECNQQRVAPGLHDPAAVLLDRRGGFRHVESRKPPSAL
jgi:hypothetical protein